MIERVCASHTLSPSLSSAESAGSVEIKTHLNKVNYFLRFLDSKRKTMLGMISYDQIITGLKDELKYFDSVSIKPEASPKEKEIAESLHELITNFLEKFEASLAHQK